MFCSAELAEMTKRSRDIILLSPIYLSDMKITALEAFVAAIEESSLRAAARRAQRQRTQHQHSLCFEIHVVSFVEILLFRNGSGCPA